MKTVFVTGGTRGIGRGVVEKFRDEGYFVVFTYNSSSQIAEELRSETVLPFQCSNNDFEGLRNLKIMLEDRDISIDIIVNNAAILLDRTLLKMSDEEWFRVINTNLNSIYVISKLFLENMIEQKWGRIINLASFIGQKGGFGQTNYSASKAGIIGFSKSLALEVASKGITVNVVSPGIIDTDIYKSVPEDRMQSLINSIPMKSMGTPLDVAEIIYFLSTEKGNYITGQIIGVNGGLY